MYMHYIISYSCFYFLLFYWFPAVNGTYEFTPVCLFVRPSVHPSALLVPKKPLVLKLCMMLGTNSIESGILLSPEYKGK